MMKVKSRCVLWNMDWNIYICIRNLSAAYCLHFKVCFAHHLFPFPTTNRPRKTVIFNITKRTWGTIANLKISNKEYKLKFNYFMKIQNFIFMQYMRVNSNLRLNVPQNANTVLCIYVWKCKVFTLSAKISFISPAFLFIFFTLYELYQVQ